MMKIRKTTSADRQYIAKLQTEAFGELKGPTIAELALGLLEDETALPITSLVGELDGEIIGHIIFTNVSIGGDKNVSASILAPLAVSTSKQRQGVGHALMKEGLKHLEEAGVQLVFVLGHPTYYPKVGFLPKAGKLGFEAPYHIPEEHSDAWMVMELQQGVIGNVSGKVECSRVLN